MMSEFSLDKPDGPNLLEDVLDDTRRIKLVKLLTMDDAKKFLSPEQIESYETAQQSIDDARESAIRNEGQNIIFYKRET